MRYSKCSMDDLVNALQKINQKYDDNIIFNRFDREGFTLRVNDSKGPGHRLGFPDHDTGKQRRIVSACWHVHGDFFDALFSLVPNAVIHATGNRIDQHQGNWIDRNIGSMINPMYYSEACECNQ